MDKKEALDRIIFLLEEMDESRRRLQSAGRESVDIELALLNQQVLSLYKHIQQFHKAESRPEREFVVTVPKPEPPKENPVQPFRVPIETRPEPKPQPSYTPPTYKTPEPPAHDIVELPETEEKEAVDHRAQEEPISEKPLEAPVYQAPKPPDTDLMDKQRFEPQVPQPMPPATPEPENVQEETSIESIVQHEPLDMPEPEPEPEPATDEPIDEAPPVREDDHAAAAEAPRLEPKPEPAPIHQTESAKPDIASIYAQARERVAQASEQKKTEHAPTLADRLREQQHQRNQPAQPTVPIQPVQSSPQPTAPAPVAKAEETPLAAPAPQHETKAEATATAPMIHEAPKTQEPERPREEVPHTPEPVKTDTPTLADKLAAHQPATPTLNERLGTQHVKRNLADKLKLSPIADLRTAISINQRVAFIKQLFGGDEKEFKRVINFVNSSRNYSEAKMFLQTEVIPSRNWSDENPLVEDFMELVYRKFL